MGSKKMFALVKWIGGDDDKKYTVGIDVEHIKNFDYDKFNSDDEDPDKIYVVEWHESKKEPLGGWICFSAQIIAVSGSLANLKKKMKAIDGIESPRRMSLEITDDKGPGQNDYSIIKDGPKIDESEVPVIDPEIDYSPEVKRKKLLGGNDGNENIDIFDDDKAEASGSKVFSSDQNDDEDLLIIKEKNVRPGGSEFVTKHELSEAITMALQKVLAAIPATSSVVPTLSDCSKTKRSKNKKNNMIELGQPGSNVFVTSDQWIAAEATKSFTAMTTSLLVSVFPTDQLIKSNYKGGPPKNAIDKTVIHTGLENTNELKAIKEAVQQRFKNNLIRLSLVNALT
ncbi:uncharacterized protein LOC123263417 [Cotesia glomerata]|uniref:uncharacterized protein LOC123263417 n=1 Tax=Cotesia glomerata TaxID=32391 RepID=UPI001D00E285|nr:uncharacterized protein LOC123263417 [Cotesia glomerata]